MARAVFRPDEPPRLPPSVAGTGGTNGGQPNGTVRLGVAVEREALATDLRSALERAGFAVQAGVFQAAAGRVSGEFTITAGRAGGSEGA